MKVVLNVRGSLRTTESGRNRELEMVALYRWPLVQVATSTGSTVTKFNASDHEGCAIIKLGYKRMSQINAFLRARRMQSCDHCNLIGSANISVGATEWCPESPDPLSTCW